MKKTDILEDLALLNVTTFTYYIGSSRGVVVVHIVHRAFTSF